MGQPGVDEAQGRHRQETGQAIAIYADQLDSSMATSTTEASPPNSFSMMAIMYGDPKATP